MLALGVGDVLHPTAADFMLAELDLHAGDPDEAERRILACLAVYTELESERSRAECLVVLGGCAAARERYEDAARLFGAASRLRGDAPPNRFERPVLDRYLPELASRLGGEHRVAELEREGARIGVDALLTPVVQETAAD